MIIQNPIIKGFNPDPSICRVGDDYYIATSTFQWFPGVQIHHSRDLKNWELIARPLNRVSQLNMLGVPDSGGVWAPCLTYDNGIFYLIYTNVLSYGYFRDHMNYLVTARDICGDWSEPIYLNSSGFDPSLFHDDDGRKWLVNMKLGNRIGENTFEGILLQEYNPDLKRLVGPIKNIFKGTELELTEGPHLYKRNGYYYLMTAEGGTSYEHAVTLACAENIDGPYELHPENPILTAYGTDHGTALQKAGHASIVQGNGDDWFMVHLCGRPVAGTGRCILGRETAIQRVEWRDDGWPYLAGGGRTPATQIEVDDSYAGSGSATRKLAYSMHDDFDNDRLDFHFQTLRAPIGRDMSLKERPGYLRLYGGYSLSAQFQQSLVARRQQAFSYTAVTCVEFEPETCQQLAGLICYYDTQNYYYLRVSYDEELGGKCLGVIANFDGDTSASMQQKDNIPINSAARVFMKVIVEGRDLNFFYSLDKYSWLPIGDTYDASTLSDDARSPLWGFTGAFVGICCQDLSGLRKYADFDYFSYIENE